MIFISLLKKSAEAVVQKLETLVERLSLVESKRVFLVHKTVEQKKECNVIINSIRHILLCLKFDA